MQLLYCLQIHQVDVRTNQQKADDLIQEYLGQLELSSGSDSVSEIESRLRSLQGVSNVSKKVHNWCINNNLGIIEYYICSWSFF